MMAVLLQSNSVTSIEKNLGRRRRYSPLSFFCYSGSGVFDTWVWVVVLFSLSPSFFSSHVDEMKRRKETNESLLSWVTCVPMIVNRCTRHFSHFVRSTVVLRYDVSCIFTQVIPAVFFSLFSIRWRQVEIIATLHLLKLYLIIIDIPIFVNKIFWLLLLEI